MIDKEKKLFRVFEYLKQYPTRRAHQLQSLSSIRKYIMFLASVVDELSTVWNDRHRMSNRTPHHFRSMLTGSIDTFPVCVSRPVDYEEQSYLYNGKYKQHVYKVFVHMGVLVTLTSNMSLICVQCVDSNDVRAFSSPMFHLRPAPRYNIRHQAVSNVWS